jgi:threonylcarbamoyladenosine tRNA methylthiotransferase MtaB
MPYFHIITFGCKVNQCDTAGLAQELTGLGWRAAPQGAAPDLVLINTCTVTARADQQARQAIRRLARKHPGLPLWVTGCYAQRAPQEVAALPGVRAVLGNREKPRLGEICRELLPPPEPGGAGPHSPSAGAARPAIHVGPYSPAEPFHPWRVHSFPGHTRASMKIQEGCRHHCSYCIVPQVRGPRRSMALRDVLAALPELAAAGYQEVVLTGVDLGQYGQDLDPPGTLAGLVARLKESARPIRVRLSSLEPQEVTADLLRELASWENFCPHFHLPLQSGAPEILAAMGRPYRPREFRDLCLEIHRIFPQAALGLDILVGFPGETAAHFAATRELVASLPAAYLHVFP